MTMESNYTRGTSRFSDADGWSESCREAMDEAIDQYPLSTTIGAFAVGLSLGVLVGAALVQPFHSSHRRTAEHLGRRILDAVQEYVPSSVNQYLHS